MLNTSFLLCSNMDIEIYSWILSGWCLSLLGHKFIMGVYMYWMCTAHKTKLVQLLPSCRRNNKYPPPGSCHACVNNMDCKNLRWLIPPPLLLSYSVFSPTSPTLCFDLKQQLRICAAIKDSREYEYINYWRFSCVFQGCFISLCLFTGVICIWSEGLKSWVEFSNEDKRALSAG